MFANTQRICTLFGVFLSLTGISTGIGPSLPNLRLGVVSSSPEGYYEYVMYPYQGDQEMTKLSLNFTSSASVDINFFSDWTEFGSLQPLMLSCNNTTFTATPDGSELEISFGNKDDCLSQSISNLNEQISVSKQFKPLPFSMFYSGRDDTIETNEFGWSMTAMRPSNSETPYSVGPFLPAAPVYEFVRYDLDGIDTYIGQIVVTSEETADVTFSIITKPPFPAVNISMNCDSVAAKFNEKDQTFQIGLLTDRSSCYKNFVNELNSKLPVSSNWTRGDLPQTFAWDAYMRTLSTNLLVPADLALLE